MKIAKKQGWRYFLDCDGNGDWYIIPVEWRREWQELIYHSNHWELFEWKKFEECKINGEPQFVTFENPKYD